MSASASTSNPRVSWNPKKDEFVLDRLTDAVNAGQRYQSGFKKEVFQDITNWFNARFSVNYSISQIKTHYQATKKTQAVFAKLLKMRGFGWDRILQTVTASAEVWDEYLAAPKAAEQFRGQSFPLRDKYDAVFDGRTAIGEGAMTGFPSGSQTLSSSSGSQTPTVSASGTGIGAANDPPPPYGSAAFHGSVENEIMQDDAEDNVTPAQIATQGSSALRDASADSPSPFRKPQRPSASATAVADALEILGAQKPPKATLVQQAMQLVIDDAVMAAADIFVDTNCAAIFCSLGAAQRKM
ncbi:Myb/SANT-like DNA-binding domain-containing protein [Phlyctochytrium arcticum]|nr:Myb/SANT-like DNA-binding domain-containing protein [Phlyctochytrium arcticum]